MKKNDDNPFRNALPPLLSESDFLNNMNSRPALETGSKEELLLEIPKIESDFMFALSKHYWFYQDIVSDIYESYRVRTPFWMVKKIIEQRTVEKEEVIYACKDQIRKSPSVFVTYLSGIAGTGKTSIINFLLSQFPNFIRHENLGITQVPILKIQTPPKGTRIDLAREILRELDDMVRGQYSARINSYTENGLVDHVKSILLTHFVGCIIFDEFQDLRVSKSKGPSEQTLAFVKRLTNSLCIPVVFVGSPEMEEVIFGNFQLATRAKGYVWDRLDKNSREWTRFMENLYKQNVFPETQLSDQMQDAYYELTQGIPRVLVKLHVHAQRIAVLERAEALSVNHLLIAANTVLKSVAVPILGIRRRIKVILDRYPDLANLEVFAFQKQHNEINSNTTAGKTENKNDLKTNTTDKQTDGRIASLTSLDISQFSTGSLFSYVENCHTEMEVRDLLLECNVILPVSELVEF